MHGHRAWPMAVQQRGTNFPGADSSADLHERATSQKPGHWLAAAAGRRTDVVPGCRLSVTTSCLKPFHRSSDDAGGIYILSEFIVASMTSTFLVNIGADDRLLGDAELFHND